MLFHFRSAIFLFLPAILLANGLGNEAPKFSASQWASLKKGQPVLFSSNPNCPCSKSKSYVNGAVVIRKGTDAVWQVVNDPETAPNYINDLKTARIVSTRGNSRFVEQGMKVTGLRNLVKYVVRMETLPQQRLMFEFESGNLRAMDGGWWVYPLRGGDSLLVYSLFLDPGRLAPKSLVRRSLQKKIPETLVAVRGEVLRRANAVAKR